MVYFPAAVVYPKHATSTLVTAVMHEKADVLIWLVLDACGEKGRKRNVELINARGILTFKNSYFQLAVVVFVSCLFKK